MAEITIPEDDNWDRLEGDIITCRRCPRLVAWREEVAATKRRAYEDWVYWGKPVPGFGDRSARLLILGLAPGAHGSNRTGRMFTGDSSGETLFGALYRTGFANQPTSEYRGDGLQLDDVFITAVGRCVPPQNRPTAQELDNCRSFLAREIALLRNLEVVLALGQVALKGYLRFLADTGRPAPKAKFSHDLTLSVDTGPTIVASYHPSRQNTQTGRLTLAMFDQVFEQIRHDLDRG
ncbi:MAG: uracil-DNA glycosylase [Anaerolineae bacterium]|nr:uracil-DNA glycosylase [Anaerolineae bacterium]